MRDEGQKRLISREKIGKFKIEVVDVVPPVLWSNFERCECATAASFYAIQSDTCNSRASEPFCNASLKETRSTELPLAEHCRINRQKHPANDSVDCSTSLLHEIGRWRPVFLRRRPSGTTQSLRSRLSSPFKVQTVEGRAGTHPNTSPNHGQTRGRAERRIPNQAAALVTAALWGFHRC